MNDLHKWIAIAIAALLMLTATAVAEEISSSPFRLPEVQLRPTEEPAGTAEAEPTETNEASPADEGMAALTDPEIPEDAPAAQTVSRGGLPLLAGPDESAETIAEVPSGALVRILEKDGGWVRVAYDGVTGYLPAASLAVYTGEEEADSEIERSIRLTSTLKNQRVLRAGSPVTLTAQLTGFEEGGYRVQWQYSPDGGATAYDIEGANELTYTYSITAENLSYLWRVVVTPEED